MSDAVQKEAEEVYALYETMTKLCNGKSAGTCFDALALVVADIVFNTNNSTDTSAKAISVFNEKMVKALSFLYAKEMVNASLETKQ